MLRSITASITALSLLAPANVFANHCVSPFASNLQNFQLVEKLDCTKATFPVVLNIIPANQTAVTGRWQPTCADQSPYFELFAGSLVVGYSKPTANALSKEVTVLSCDGKVIFVVNRTPVIIDLPSGPKVYVSTRVLADDGSLIGYVAVSDDGEKEFALRSPDAKVLAQAAKTWPACDALWTVVNSAQTVQIANVISFLITLEDNDGFSCITTPPPYPSHAYGMFALGIPVGVVGLALLEIGAWYGWRAYQRHQANRRETTTLLQER